MSDLAADSKNKATTVFVLGLLSLVACQLLGPVALIMGNKYLADCELNGVEPDGLGKAGRILGIVGTVFFALGLVVMVLYIGLIVVMVGTGALN